MANDKRLSPIRLPLARAGRALDPSNDARREDDRFSSDTLEDALDNDTRFGDVARELGKLNTRVGTIEKRAANLEANQTLTLQEVQKSGLLLARILERVNSGTVVHEDVPPAPVTAPSFADVSFDADDEIVTAHGTKKFAYTEDALRAKMREEYMRMQKQTAKKARLVNDGWLWRFLRDDFAPKAFYILIGAAVSFAVSREFAPVPVVTSSGTTSAPSAPNAAPNAGHGAP